MRRRRVLKNGFAAVIAAACVLSVSAAGAAPPGLPGLTLVSRDSIVDGLALHQTQTQPSLAADSSSQKLLGAFEVGRTYNGGSSSIGWARSNNAGQTWQDGLVPLTVASGRASTPAGTVWRGADPSAAFDKSHNVWLVSATGLGSTGADTIGLFVNTTSNLQTWSAPIVAHQGATGDAPNNGSLACDNSSASAGYGNCYIAYTNTTSTPANQIFVTKSSDGGATWSAPVGTPDTSAGTGTVTLVQPPAPGAAGTCGRVVVAYVNGTTVNDITSTDCGATFSAHAVVTSTQAAQHTVAQGIRTSLVASGSTDGAGALYLAWQTRSFRTTQTTLSTAANAGDTNIKVASVTGFSAGGTITVDPTGANPETVTATTIGTAGAGGTGITFTPALAFAHAQGAIVTANGSPSTSTAAPNDIALSVMPAPTAATPAPSFGAPSRISIEADTGALSNTVDHFMPAIAADPGSSGATARLGLFYYYLPIAACQYVNNQAPMCSPQVGYVSSADGGSTWSAPQALSPGPTSVAVFPRTVAQGAQTGNGNPDFGNVLAGVVVPAGPKTGDAVGLFPVGIDVNGLDVSTYAPKNSLQIGGAS